MAHANFGKPEPEVLCLSQDFSINEKLFRFDGHTVENLAAEELERAINITHAYSEYDSHKQVENPAYHEAGQRVEAIDAKAAYDVRIFDERQQAVDLANVELIIRISIENQFMSRAGEAFLESFGVTEVRAV